MSALRLLEQITSSHCYITRTWLLVPCVQVFRDERTNDFDREQSEMIIWEMV